MSSPTPYRIAVLAGDGIGPEVTNASLQVLRAIEQQLRRTLVETLELDAGADCYQRTGVAMSDETLQAAGDADAILLGAMGLPAIRYQDGTEISPQLDLREKLELYAGVRPITTMPGLPLPLADKRSSEINAVLVRESTEGLFAARGKTDFSDPQVALDTMVISRKASERLFEFAFKLAEKRNPDRRVQKVTCVDKANVLGGFAFFRKIFDEVSEKYPAIQKDYCYVDACGLNLVRAPWNFDVLVTENMFGDILSDVGAALMGGMGMAPSADIGDDRALFQPAHGSAPDIMGQGKANPTAMLLSVALMLDWLGNRHQDADCSLAATWLEQAVRQAFASGNLLPFELGGTAGTAEIRDAVLAQIEHARPN